MAQGVRAYKKEAKYLKCLEKIDDIVPDPPVGDLPAEILSPTLEKSLFFEGNIAYLKDYPVTKHPELIITLTSNDNGNIVNVITPISDYVYRNTLQNLKKEEVTVNVNYAFEKWLRETIVVEHCKRLGLVVTDGVEVRFNGVEVVEGRGMNGMTTGIDDERVFAKMLVTLPTEQQQFAGGEVVVRMSSGGKNETLFLHDNQGLVRVATWYTNETTTKHKPLKSGYRISLAYSLLLLHNSTALPSPSTTMRSHSRILSLLSANSHAHMILLLKHQYPPPLSTTTLWTTDASTLRKLLGAVSVHETNWMVHLCSVEVKITVLHPQLGSDGEVRTSVDVGNLQKVYGEFTALPIRGMLVDINDVLGFDGGIGCDTQITRRFEGTEVEVTKVYKRTGVFLYPVIITGKVLGMTERPHCVGYTLPGGKQKWEEYALEQSPLSTDGKYAVVDVMRAVACGEGVHGMCRARGLFYINGLKGDDAEMCKRSMVQWVGSRKDVEKMGVRGWSVDDVVRRCLWLYGKLDVVKYGDVLVECVDMVFQEGLQDFGLLTEAVEVMGEENMERFAISASLGIPSVKLWALLRQSLPSPTAFDNSLQKRISSFAKAFYNRGIATNNHKDFKLDNDNLNSIVRLISYAGNSRELLKLLLDGVHVTMRHDAGAGGGSVLVKGSVGYTATQRAVDEVYVPLVLACKTVPEVVKDDAFGEYLDAVKELVKEAYEAKPVPRKVNVVKLGSVNCGNYVGYLCRNQGGYGDGREGMEIRPLKRVKLDTDGPGVADEDTGTVLMPHGKLQTEDGSGRCRICTSINDFLKDDSSDSISFETPDVSEAPLKLHDAMMKDFVTVQKLPDGVIDVKLLQHEGVRRQGLFAASSGGSTTDGGATLEIVKKYKRKYDYTVWENEQWGKRRDEILGMLEDGKGEGGGGKRKAGDSVMGDGKAKKLKMQ